MNAHRVFYYLSTPKEKTMTDKLSIGAGRNLRRIRKHPPLTPGVQLSESSEPCSRTLTSERSLEKRILVKAPL